jgi:hypothetical protein
MIDRSASNSVRELENQLKNVLDQLRKVYRDRAALAAYVAAINDAVLSTDPEESDRPDVAYIHTPAGLVSYHIDPADLHLFEHLPRVERDHPMAQWTADLPRTNDVLRALTRSDVAKEPADADPSR